MILVYQVNDKKVFDMCVSKYEGKHGKTFCFQFFLQKPLMLAILWRVSKQTKKFFFQVFGKSSPFLFASNQSTSKALQV